MAHASLRSLARSFVLIIGCLGLGAAPLHAQNGLESAEKQKLGLRLQPVVEATAKRGGTPGPLAPEPFRGGNGTGKAGGAPTYAVFVHTDAPDAVRGTGAAVDSRFDGFVTARATATEIRALAGLDAVQKVRASGTARLHNDEAAAFVGARALNNGLVEGTEYTGEGVLACVIDSGIDYDHPDFVDDDGNSRIVSIWDQTFDTDGQTPYDRHSGLFSSQNSFDYGTEYHTPQIESGGLSTGDPSGHGTHVAGTVGASGNADPAGKYKGMAPGVNYIIVRHDTNPVSKGPIDGLKFCDKVAEQKGMPMVANKSLGTHDGPHDGTSEWASGIDEVLNDGSAAKRAVVVSAGNEGGRKIHTSASIAASTSETVGIDVPSYTPRSGNGNDLFFAQLWFDRDLEATATVTTPNGATVTVGPGETKNPTTANDGAILVENKTYPGNGDRAIQIIAVDPTSENTPSAGTWAITLQNDATSSVTVDGWLVPAMTTIEPNEINFVNGDTESTVGIPGTATHAITVGSFMHRWRWYGADGSQHRDPVNENRSGLISSFSSEGPRRDGTGAAYKPEIAAPGQNMLSSLSQDVSSFSPSKALSGLMHVKKKGTSMSAPVVTGSVALLLEEDPSLTASEIKTLLTQTADQDGLTGSTPNTEWGYGRLDVLEAMTRLVDASGDATHNIVANDFHPNDTYEQRVVLGGSGVDKQAIRFTPPNGGRLSGAYFHLYTTAKSLTDSLAVELRRDDGGVPGAQVGSTVKIPPSRLRTGTWNYQSLLGTDVSLSAGQDYYLMYYPDKPSDELALMAETYDGSGNSLGFSDGSWAEASGGDILVRPVVSSLSGVQELPVELVAFGAAVSGRTATLRWETASETNNARFEVQRRRVDAGDGIGNSRNAWTTVGQVDGAGTTTTAQEYTYTVDSLSYGRHRFRLKQMDVDGTAHLSQDVQAVVTPSEGLTVRASPNPVSTTATVRVSVGHSQDVAVTVYDVLGRRVARLYDGAVSPTQPVRRQLDGRALGSGTYFIRVRGEQQTATERVTVVR